MITREQVADLQPGDVVEVVYRGSITREASGYVYVNGRKMLCTPDGDPAAWTSGAELTVVSRAPRPLYANHPRTEPVPGDVVRVICTDAPDDCYTNVYLPRDADEHRPWVELSPPHSRYERADAEPRDLAGWEMHLLVDGETGQTVPAQQA